MATIDLTMDSFLIPNMPSFQNIFGSMKPGAKEGNSTAENITDMMMPFVRQRPFVVTEDSDTTEVQANSLIIMNGDVSTLQLSAGAYIGCLLKIINLTGHTVDILAGINVFSSDPGEVLPLVYMPGGWMRTNHLPPGIILHSALNDYALAQERYLPLTGAVLPIADYPGLCRRVYVGDERNATAPTFFKTSDASGAVRNINGLYLTTPNAIGIFLRGAGSQTVHVVWNDSTPNHGEHTEDTLYDGKTIGASGNDTMRRLSGSVSAQTRNGESIALFSGADGVFYLSGSGQSGNLTGVGSSANAKSFVIDTSRQAPVGTETTPAFVAMQICITF
jgi:hypothetical protein